MNRGGVRVQRRYAATPGEIWAALVDPAILGRWLAPAGRVEPHEGGAFELDFPDASTTRMDGRVRAIEQGRLLELEWSYPGEPPSVVRFEIEEVEDGTSLVVDHRGLERAAATGYGVGWQRHLDRLRLALGLGEVRADGEHAALRYERVYAASPAEVWAAFTEPDSIRRWLFADAVVEPRVGGRFELRWNEGAARGEVVAWDPPLLFEATWDESNVASILRVEISSSGDGALLVLDHRGLTRPSAVGTGAGWHAHLAALGDLLTSRDAIEDRWHERFERLKPVYGDLVARL
jgi:uncharacterized protein YndB with AHSA1/START domain